MWSTVLVLATSMSLLKPKIISDNLLFSVSMWSTECTVTVEHLVFHSEISLYNLSISWWSVTSTTFSTSTGLSMNFSTTFSTILSTYTTFSTSLYSTGLC